MHWINWWNFVSLNPTIVLSFIDMIFNCRFNYIYLYPLFKTRVRGEMLIDNKLKLADSASLDCVQYIGVVMVHLRKRSRSNALGYWCLVSTTRHPWDQPLTLSWRIHIHSLNMRELIEFLSSTINILSPKMLLQCTQIGWLELPYLPQIY